jgi:hypothetical protein
MIWKDEYELRMTMMMCGGLILQVSLTILPFEEEVVKTLIPSKTHAKWIAMRSSDISYRPIL